MAMDVLQQCLTPLALFCIHGLSSPAMSSFPCQHLVFGSDKAAVVSGHHYSILNLQCGHFLPAIPRCELRSSESGTASSLNPQHS